jgi:hypothetical protein
MAKQKQAPGEPTTLGNMRKLSVQGLNAMSGVTRPKIPAADRSTQCIHKYRL